MTASPNPWEVEPDHLDGVLFGLPCIILRHNEYGTLCGYVGVFKKSPYYGLPHCANSSTSGSPAQQHINQIRVHGGLTFSGKLGYKKASKKAWFFGFDCMHGYDYVPSMPSILQPLNREYRDISYVKDQVQRLAWQLAGNSLEDEKAYQKAIEKELEPDSTKEEGWDGAPSPAI